MMQFEDDDAWGLYDGQCQACDLWGRVNDLGLCEECDGKFDRDLIRQRNWDYSASAFGLGPDDLEKLRGQVIAQYGEALELIAPAEQQEKSSPRSGQTAKKRSARRPRKRARGGAPCI